MAMVKRFNNELIWNSGFDDGVFLTKAIGEWNQPDNYPNLTEAIYKSLDQAKQFIAGSLVSLKSCS